MVTTIAFVKKTAAELKKASVKFFQGEITVSKRECWLVGIILLLTGIAIGLINAPLTHGVNISMFSNNGNNSGNGNGNGNGTDNGDDSPIHTDKDKLCQPNSKKGKNKCRCGRKEYDNQ
ncbi:MAG: hypothetical protein NC433_05620 [Clostridiales bacterium]|nr:hypothetical protein [Clostridiales bacterium]